MRIQRLSWLLAGALLLAAVSLPAAAGVRVYVNVPPPSIRVEAHGVAPGPHHVWIDGYHRWDGVAYVWVPGRWAAPPRAHAHWKAGHWVKSHRGWYWVDGHWK
jgi:hypothetical protein